MEAAKGRELILESDIIIVGAGVVGCGLARVLSRYDCRVTVLEKADDVAEGASKANSGIVHAGFDAHPGTLKARLNVEGAGMYPELCKELGVPYSRPGALVLGFSEDDRATLETLVRQGEANGVPGVRLVERDEILKMEPHVNPEVVCALYAPTSGLTSPYEMTFALADHAALNGVVFERGTEVTGAKREGGLWHVQTGKGEFTAKVLVNCAGICSGTPLDEIDPREWDRTYAVNIRGPFFLTQRLMKYLKKGETPCVVNVSSMAGFTGGIQSNPAYSSSKAAVTCTTKNLAKFLAPYGIRVNEVSPGTAQTQMTMNWLGEDGLKPFAERVPLGRVAVAEDIGKVIFFLASDAAGFITGQSIQVNGGMYIP